MNKETNISELLLIIIEAIEPLILETELDSNYDDVLDCVIDSMNGAEEVQIEVKEDLWLTYKVSTSDGETLEIDNLEVTKKEIYYDLTTTEKNSIKRRIKDLTTIN